MAGLTTVFGLLLACLAVSTAVTVDILEPIREEGDEVALIFVPELLYQADQYRKTAQAIQAASELRVWAVLTGHYFANVPGVHQLPGAINGAIEDLKKAGMSPDSENYIGIGHGTGGYFLQDYAKDPKYKTQLKAVVLMGSFLQRSDNFLDYPLPLLTLVAELNGITRITRMVVEFRKLREAMSDSFAAVYRTPVILLDGANHAQFASGPRPTRIKQEDLRPDLDMTEDYAHSMIGRHVNNFIMTNLINSSSSSMMDSSFDEMVEAYYRSSDKFQPLLDVRNFGANSTVSLWTVEAQKHFAGQFSDFIEIHNKVEDGLGFFLAGPSIEVHNNRITAKTVTFVQLRDNELDLDTEEESPVEVNMKLNSEDAIRRTVVDVSKLDKYQPNRPFASNRGAPTTCRSLNELALEIALLNSSPKSRDRYKARGRPIIFERDSVCNFEFMWHMTPLQSWEEEDGLHVQSVSYSTSSDFAQDGVNYCKVISPYRAMEWVNVDSLRDYPDWI